MRKAALNTVYELAKTNSKIIFIGSDLGHSTLINMQKDLPNQFFMEGISEQYIVGFAAGLAKEGFVPYINTIANFFSRRALEQIIIDVALHNLPVKFLGSGGGMVYAPLGPTHTATDDFAHMLAIPNLEVFSPCDALEMEQIIRIEADKASPAYIRFGKGGEKIISNQLNNYMNQNVKTFGDLSSDYVIISTGILTQLAVEAMEFIQESFEYLVIHLPRLNNLMNTNLIDLLTNRKKIIVLEEHQKFGGLFTQILHFLNEHNIDSRIVSSVALPNKFIRYYGSQNDHFNHWGMTVNNIIKIMENLR